MHAIAIEHESPLRILLAASDRSLLTVVNHVIKFLGHFIVGTAVSSKECIQRAKELHPDLVIADLKLPDQNGIETASKLSHTCKAPVIIMTVATDDTTVDRLLEADAAAVLPKPFTLKDVSAAIENATHAH